MAAKVEIEIPGIGLIEAKNAASEETLLEILKVLQATQKTNQTQQKTGTGAAAGAGAGGGAAAANAAATGMANSVNNASKAAGSFMKVLGTTAKMVGGTVGLLGKSAGFTVGALSVLGDKVLSVGNSFVDLGNTATSLIKQLSTMGNSVEGAAGAVTRGLSALPGVFGKIGGMLGGMMEAAAGAATSMVKSYQTAANAGATFGGNLNALNAAASGAGMTMDAFASLIDKNRAALSLLGGTTEEGAQRFAKLSKDLRTSGAGAELLRMGYSTEQVNNGMAAYIGMMGKTGALQNMTTQQIAKSSAGYLKDLDALAKITGQTREEKQKEQEALMKDAQFRAAVAGMDAESQKQMMAYITSFPKEQQAAIKDMIATGTATTEESVKLAAMMPGLANQAMAFGRTLQSGGKITQDQMNRSRDAAITEAKQNQMRYKSQGQFNTEMAGAYLGMSELAARSTGDWAKAQKETAEATKKANQAEQIEKFKQQIAGISNSFMAFLANSGVLNTMVSLFQTVVTFIQAVFIPVFNMFAAGIRALIPIIQNYVLPAFQILGQWISTAVIPIFQSIGTALSSFFGSITGGASLLEDVFEPALYAITDFIEDYFVPIFASVVGVIGATVIPALIAKGAALLANIPAYLAMAAAVIAATLPFAALVGVVVGAWMILKKFGVDLEVVADGFKWVGSWFETFMLKLQYGFYSLLNKIPGMRGDFDNDLKGISEKMSENESDREKLEKSMGDKRKANLAAEAKKEEEKAKRDESRAKAREDRDKAAQDRKHKREMGAIDEKEKREKEATEVDMSSPTAMLESFSRQQNGFFANRIDEARKEQRIRLETNEANKQMAEAQKRLAEAKTDEERKAAIEGLKAAQERLDKIKEEGKQVSKPVSTPAGAPSPSAAPLKIPTDGKLGAMAAQFESGKAGSSAVGYDSTGGTSFGKYQIATKTGTMDRFMKHLQETNPEAYARLSKAGPADSGKDGAFAQEWKKLAGEGKLQASEHDFIKKTHFDVGAKGLKDKNLQDMLGKSKALQEVMWSTSVQHGGGGASNIFNKVYKEGMSEQDLIKAIYQERGTKFGRSTEQERGSVLKRFGKEEQMALALVGQKPEPGKPGATSDTAKAKPDEAKPGEAKPKTDAQKAMDWAYSVFIGKATMSQVPKPYMDEVGKILAKPPANWSAAPTTPQTKVDTAKTEEGKPPEQKTSEVKPKLDDAAVRNWAFAVFEGKITLGQVPQMYRDKVADLLKDPPKDWTKAPGVAKPAESSAKFDKEMSESYVGIADLAAKTPGNEEFKINGKQVSKEEFDAYMKANPQAAKMMDMAKNMAAGKGMPGMDMMQKMGGSLPVGMDMPGLPEKILGDKFNSAESFKVNGKQVSKEEFGKFIESNPQLKQMMGGGMPNLTAPSIPGLNGPDAIKDKMAEATAAIKTEEANARKLMFETLGVKEGAKTPGAPGQEASADPMSLLNTKLEQLVNINQSIASVNNDQLRVQKSLNFTGDVYNSPF